MKISKMLLVILPMLIVSGVDGISFGVKKGRKLQQSCRY